MFLATPDFSMAYNVTCITSTLVALFAGVMLNTLLRCVVWEVSQVVEQALHNAGGRVRRRRWHSAGDGELLLH